MRISVKNLSRRQRFTVFGAIALTSPVSVPLLAVLIIHRRLRKKKFKVAKSGQIADLRRKLWEGFGETTSAAIRSILTEERFRPKERAELAYELARWNAVQTDWAKVLDLLDHAAKLNQTTLRRAQPIMLRLEALLRLGHLEDAKITLDHSEGVLNPTEYALAKSNYLLLTEGGRATSARLALLNEVCAAEGLGPIALNDPEGAVDIDNLVGFDVKPVIRPEKVSVIFPVFQASAHLDTALRGIRQQSYTNLEILVIDDASVDESWAIIQRHAAEDDRIIALRNSENAGAYRTRNRGLRHATGEFVTVHDSDDWSHPDMIATQVKHLDIPNIRAVFGTAVRVNEDMRIMLAPQIPTLNFMRLCYPAFMAKREDFLSLGGWDEVRMSADDEMVKRFVAQFGGEHVLQLRIGAPLTFQRLHEASLTQHAETSVASSAFGLRATYKIQHGHWRERQLKGGLSLAVDRKSLKHPFPIPSLMMEVRKTNPEKYDLVLISDFGLMGGTRRCNEGYIAAASAEGMRVGLYSYPNWDLPVRPIASSYLDLCAQPNVDLLTKEDVLRTPLVLLHHPPILKHRIDAVPTVDCDLVAMLVNQSPMELYSETPWLYDAATVSDNCIHFFGQKPLWIPISGRVRDTLSALDGYTPVLDRIWYPPYVGEVMEETRLPASDGSIKIGRHSRDHWTKWPATLQDTNAAYCAAVEGIETHILGGASKRPKRIGFTPSNWKIYDFDTVPVIDFLDGLDVFINFMHPDYIEEFGRNTMEAMARGTPVILEHGLVDTFGDAALYCEPAEVSEKVRRLMSDVDLYRSQVGKGLDFVRAHCSQGKTRENLRDLIAHAKQKAAGRNHVS